MRLVTTVPRVVGLLMTGVLGTTAYAQRLTIPESLERAGKSLSHVRTVPSGRAPALADVLAETEIAVRGTVGDSESYLSPDKRDVLTDYRIDDVVLLYQPAVITAPRPGALPGLIVTVLGGQVTINGLSYTSTHQALPLLKQGAEVLLLLEKAHDRCRIALGYYGAFAVQGERLMPLTAKQGFAPELRDLPADQAIADMVAQLRAMRP